MIAQKYEFFDQRFLTGSLHRSKWGRSDSREAWRIKRAMSIAVTTKGLDGKVVRTIHDTFSRWQVFERQYRPQVR